MSTEQPLLGLVIEYWQSESYSRWQIVLITLVLAYADTAHSDKAPDPRGSLVPSTTNRMTDRQHLNP